MNSRAGIIPLTKKVAKLFSMIEAITGLASIISPVRTKMSVNKISLIFKIYRIMSLIFIVLNWIV